MQFQPLTQNERTRLHVALRRNVDGDAILTSPRDTSFQGFTPEDQVTDEEVISAIRSVPCHY